jgi:aspartyl-tRNA(Asn)/glutamyl-tRNA(Gln) amidotransferase subunit C
MATTIDTDQVRHIARLARLRFTEQEITDFTLGFNQIVAYVDKLNEAPTDGVEPMESLLDVVNVLRDDEPGPMLTSAEALQNAPEKIEGFFGVPKVIGDSTE